MENCFQPYNCSADHGCAVRKMREEQQQKIQTPKNNPQYIPQFQTYLLPSPAQHVPKKQLYRHKPWSENQQMGTVTTKSILPPAQKTSYREQMEIEEIWGRVLNISRHTENNRKRRFNYFENLNVCTFYALHTIQCTLTDTYYPFLEESRKTSVISYSLLWSPECFIKFSVNSYRKCWISDFSYTWEVLCSVWKQSVWEIFYLRKIEKKKNKRKTKKS